jgi:hypothetical protein
MTDNQVSDVLAMLCRRGVNTLFTLMGDANMYWSASMADNHSGPADPRPSRALVRWPMPMPRYRQGRGRLGDLRPGYTQIMIAGDGGARNAPGGVRRRRSDRALGTYS